MSFNKPTPKLKNVQEEFETRCNGNASTNTTKKRTFTIAKQKKEINTPKPAYIPPITPIRRSFELRHPYMASWSPVCLFLFLLQPILELLLHHTNQRAQTSNKRWNTLTMMKLRQWVAIRILIAQNLAKTATIQSFWSRETSNNPPLNRNRYQTIERHLNVKSSLQMPYNNAPWFWKIKRALNAFRIQLLEFTVPDNHLAVNKSTIKFHSHNSNKFRLAHKPAKKGFVLYALASEKEILHDFMLWNSRDGLEYHKQGTTVNIPSRTTKERKKSTTEATAMKVHLPPTKRVVYTLCERVTRNLHHLQFVCFTDNLFTDPHLAKTLLTLNVGVCGTVRGNAPGIPKKLKAIAAAKKPQLALKQWIHRVVDGLINCFVWRDAQRDHVVTFGTTTYTPQASEQAPRKTRHTTGIPLRDGTLKITVEQPTIAVQYNLHMGHMDRANQLRANLTIARPQEPKWTMRMIEYMIDSAYINAYLVWTKHQAKQDLSHRDRRVFTKLLTKELLQSSDIVHQPSISTTSTYCKWNNCSVNNHTKPRKRQALASISTNIQHRKDRKTFDYYMTCKKSLCVQHEYFNSYHESIETQYKCFDQ